ncbi:Thrombospondin type-1 domain-containing protein 4-like 1, partial [Homarus americanus]
AGSQTTRVVCVKRKRGNEVPSSHCRVLPRPAEETVRCNLRPCPATWVAEEWGPCSVTCGLGVQTRALTCKMRLSPDHSVAQPEGACLTTPDIPKAQVCELAACDSAPTWQTGEWGQCSAQCGLGTRHRSVTCITPMGTVPDHLCDARDKPSNQELCDMGSCATDTWFFSAWEDRCSEECGDGVQRRRVHCSGDALDNQVTESSCDPEQRPSTTRACTSDRSCGGKWFTGPWGDCNAECGPGRRSRSVVCVVFRGRWRVTTDVSQCKGDPRPDSTETCTRPCSHEWYTSEWSQCSASCASGVQRREVKCLDERQMPALDCTAASKPDTRQPCNTQSCHQECITWDCASKCITPGDCAHGCILRLCHGCVPQDCAMGVSPWGLYHGCITPGDCAWVYHPEDCTLRCMSPLGTVPLGVSLGDCALGCITPGECAMVYHPGDCAMEQADESVNNSSTRNDLPQLPSGLPPGDTPDRKSSGNVALEAGWRPPPQSLEAPSPDFRSPDDIQDYDEGTNRDTDWDWASRGGDEEEEEETEQPSDRSPPSPSIRRRRPVTPGRPWRPGLSTGSCIDRMKNCHLVYKARLCRLKYYNKLCCDTCTKNQ